jgi:hypothetical protein
MQVSLKSGRIYISCRQESTEVEWLEPLLSDYEHNGYTLSLATQLVRPNSRLSYHYRSIFTDAIDIEQCGSGVMIVTRNGSAYYAVISYPITDIVWVRAGKNGLVSYITK